MGINTAWYEGLDEKEKKETESLIKASSLLLRRLDQVLDNQQKNLDRVENNLDVYSSPSWAYKQAHLNGTRQAYQTMKALLRIDI